MEFVSTRGLSEPVGFFDAFANGLAPDGGLYVPKHLPLLPSDLLVDEALPYPALAWDFLSLFDSDHDSDHLIDLIDRSYGDFSEEMSAPLQQVSDNTFILELFHGPTLAFKDFGLQLMGNLFEEQIERTGETINVLGATSGDTGAAAIAGLAGKKGVNVFILYPKGRISDLQERQMTCTGEGNIFPIPVEGTFDDCQAIVKELLGDPDLKSKLRLSAVNSINIVRILAQSIYYVHAYMQLPQENRDDVRFVVPTGNFGNVFSGWMVHQMGLPVDDFVVATNKNDILYRLFETGTYSSGTVDPSSAPSMDIQVASNFERFLYYHNEKNADKTLSQMADFAANGSIHVPEFNSSNLSATRCDDDEILENIRKVKEEFNYVVDPHTACGFQDLDLASTHVVLATAHPAKFPDVIEKAIGERPTEDSLEALKKKKQVNYPVENSAEAVRKFLEDNAL
ncbi:threonine synthase [Verrucomicrobiales bacterium BCK34]|nr:threonine synthase [Verrucomicrobiales bacterium BCK34]